MRWAAASSAVEPDRLDRVRRQALLGQQRFPGVDAQQERGPERQHHEHQQGRLERAARARHEVGERVADRQAEQRRDRGVEEARDVGAQVEVVLHQQQVVAELGADGDRAVLPGDDVLDRRRLHLGDADLGDDEKGQQEEDEQPRVRDRDDGEAAALRADLHCVSTTCDRSVQVAHAESPQVSGAPGWRSTLLWLILRTRPLAICRW